MKKLFNILLFLAAPVALLAQSNYKPGYIVTPKGDTVKGFVDYQEWDANPEAINFKKASDSQGVKYRTGEISAFGVDRIDLYRAATVSITLADPLKPEYVRDTAVRTAIVFLRVLEQGSRIALYSYRDDIKIRYYIGDAPSYQPRELIYRVYNDPDFANKADRIEGSRSPELTENTFQKQLSAEAYKYDELKGNMVALITRSIYVADDIQTIVRKINHTSKAAYAKDHYTGSPISFFAGVGLSICKTSSDAGTQYSVAGGTSYTSPGPMVSFGLDLFANPATRRLQFRIELSGAQNKYQSLYTSKVSPYKPMEVSFNTTALSISPQVIYNFYNGDKFKVFVGVGAMFSHFSYSNAYFGTQNHDGSGVSIATNEPFFFIKSDDAMLGKAGIQIGHHFVIYGAVQSNVTVTEDTYFGLGSSYKQIGINYLF